MGSEEAPHLPAWYLRSDWSAKINKKLQRGRKVARQVLGDGGTPWQVSESDYTLDEEVAALAGMESSGQIVHEDSGVESRIESGDGSLKGFRSSPAAHLQSFGITDPLNRARASRSPGEKDVFETLRERINKARDSLATELGRPLSRNTDRPVSAEPEGLAQFHRNTVSPFHSQSKGSLSPVPPVESSGQATFNAIDYNNSLRPFSRDDEIAHADAAIDASLASAEAMVAERMAGRQSPVVLERSRSPRPSALLNSSGKLDKISVPLDHSNEGNSSSARSSPAKQKSPVRWSSPIQRRSPVQTSFPLQHRTSHDAHKSFSIPSKQKEKMENLFGSALHRATERERERAQVERLLETKRLGSLIDDRHDNMVDLPVQPSPSLTKEDINEMEKVAQREVEMDLRIAELAESSRVSKNETSKLSQLSVDQDVGLARTVKLESEVIQLRGMLEAMRQERSRDTAKIHTLTTEVEDLRKKASSCDYRESVLKGELDRSLLGLEESMTALRQSEIYLETYREGASEQVHDMKARVHLTKWTLWRSGLAFRTWHLMWINASWARWKERKAMERADTHFRAKRGLRLLQGFMAWLLCLQEKHATKADVIRGNKTSKRITLLRMAGVVREWVEAADVSKSATNAKNEKHYRMHEAMKKLKQRWTEKYFFIWLLIAKTSSQKKLALHRGERWFQKKHMKTAYTLWHGEVARKKLLPAGLLLINPVAVCQKNRVRRKFSYWQRVIQLMKRSRATRRKSTQRVAFSAIIVTFREWKVRAAVRKATSRRVRKRMPLILLKIYIKSWGAYARSGGMKKRSFHRIQRHFEAIRERDCFYFWKQFSNLSNRARFTQELDERHQIEFACMHSHLVSRVVFMKEQHTMDRTFHSWSNRVRSVSIRRNAIARFMLKRTPLLIKKYFAHWAAQIQEQIAETKIRQGQSLKARRVCLYKMKFRSFDSWQSHVSLVRQWRKIISRTLQRRDHMWKRGTIISWHHMVSRNRILTKIYDLLTEKVNSRKLVKVLGRWKNMTMERNRTKSILSTMLWRWNNRLSFAAVREWRLATEEAQYFKHRVGKLKVLSLWNGKLLYFLRWKSVLEENEIREKLKSINDHTKSRFVAMMGLNSLRDTFNFWKSETKDTKHRNALLKMNRNIVRRFERVLGARTVRNSFESWLGVLEMRAGLDSLIYRITTRNLHEALSWWKTGCTLTRIEMKNSARSRYQGNIERKIHMLQMRAGLRAMRMGILSWKLYLERQRRLEAKKSYQMKIIGELYKRWPVATREHFAKANVAVVDQRTGSAVELRVESPFKNRRSKKENRNPPISQYSRSGQGAHVGSDCESMLPSGIDSRVSSDSSVGIGSRREKRTQHDLLQRDDTSREPLREYLDREIIRAQKYRQAKSDETKHWLLYDYFWQWKEKIRDISRYYALHAVTSTTGGKRPQVVGKLGPSRHKKGAVAISSSSTKLSFHEKSNATSTRQEKSEPSIEQDQSGVLVLETELEELRRKMFESRFEHELNKLLQ